MLNILFALDEMYKCGVDYNTHRRTIMRIVYDDLACSFNLTLALASEIEAGSTAHSYLSICMKVVTPSIWGD